MFYIVLTIIVLSSIGAALFFSIRYAELRTQASALSQAFEEQQAHHGREVDALTAELSKLDNIRHIPDIIERARRSKDEVAARLELAQSKANEIILAARQESRRIQQEGAEAVERAQQRAEQILRSATDQAAIRSKEITAESEAALAKAQEAFKVAKWQAENLLDETRKSAKEITSQARKDAKEKTEKVEETLSLATAYVLDIRRKAEARVREIAGEAYDALRQREFNEATARALQHTVEGYQGMYPVPPAHLLDELAEEYGFHRAGERLKLARERTRLMEKNGLAATCNYPEGWKRDYAINFVLSAFNGKVDSILARVKPANQGRMIQEIKDAYALVNHNGSVFRDARIQEEYLDARLEELKRAVAVQSLKEKEKEEQRAIREQMREEERARKEYEREIKQTQKVEEEIGRALEKAKLEFEQAGDEERAKYEAKLQELDAKLKEAEERNRRALSMAQQTKSGHVYVISNIGSFGEDIFKIGLTRRLEPTERVRELGDASVPFPFDIHAIIYFDDAPALESALHKRFIDRQMNKANRRKEFFRISLREIKRAVEEMGLEAKWTIAAEAREYRETLALEEAMKVDADLKRRWVAEQVAYESRGLDEELLEEVGAMAEENGGLG
jgi:hypothetical protein